MTSEDAAAGPRLARPGPRPGGWSSPRFGDSPAEPRDAAFEFRRGRGSRAAGLPAFVPPPLVRKRWPVLSLWRIQWGGSRLSAAGPGPRAGSRMAPSIAPAPRELSFRRRPRPLCIRFHSFDFAPGQRAPFRAAAAGVYRSRGLQHLFPRPLVRGRRLVLSLWRLQGGSLGDQPPSPVNVQVPGWPLRSCRRRGSLLPPPSASAVHPVPFLLPNRPFLHPGSAFRYALPRRVRTAHDPTRARCFDNPLSFPRSAKR
jgi:hypothetical protein